MWSKFLEKPKIFLKNPKKFVLLQQPKVDKILRNEEGETTLTIIVLLNLLQ